MVRTKHCSTIIKPLCLLFNRSHNECQFPPPLKSGRVMPLYKKGPAELPSNYRPISSLSYVGKIDERRVFKHMYNFFHTNKLIYQRNPSETDSIKSQISSKTSSGKKDSTKRRHQRHHQRQPRKQLFPIQVTTG